MNQLAEVQRAVLGEARAIVDEETLRRAMGNDLASSSLSCVGTVS